MWKVIKFCRSKTIQVYLHINLIKNTTTIFFFLCPWIHITFKTELLVLLRLKYVIQMTCISSHFVSKIAAIILTAASCKQNAEMLIIKPTRCTNFSNLFMEWNPAYFGQFLCPSSGVFHCTHNNAYLSN